MKITKGMHVAFWHNGEGTIYEGTISTGEWESVCGEPELMTLVSYTNTNGRKRHTYLTRAEMTELPTLERTQRLADQFAAIFSN